MVSYFQCNKEEIRITINIGTQKTELTLTDDTITGFNIGMNIGEDADRQSFIFICILYRRKGDTNNPRGGIRGVIPEKQKYYEKIKI